MTLKNRKVLIIGSYGVVGRSLVDVFLENDYINFADPVRSSLDLLNYNQTYSYLHDYRPNVIINLFGKRTNLKLCQEFPKEIYGETIQANLNLFEACSKVRSVEKLVNIISSCAYAYADANGNEYELLKEENFDSGPVHPSISPHGEAKRAVFHMAKHYKRDGFIPITLAMNNLYGGFKTNDKYMLKVADALLVKMIECKNSSLDSITAFGTGAARRELLLFSDAARAIFEIVNYNGELPPLLNVGNGVDYSIKGLLQKIAIATDYTGEIKFDGGVDGQMKKLLDSSKFKKLFPTFSFTSLEDGLKQNVEHYKENFA